MTVSTQEFFDMLQRRFLEAGREILKMKIDGLGLYEVIDNCELTMKPTDMPATKILKYDYDGIADDGSKFTFNIYRFGKALVNDRAEPLLFEITEMHGIDLKNGTGSDNYQAHHHDVSNAIFYILHGEGGVYIGGTWSSYRPGDQFDAPAVKPHAFIVNAKAGKSVFVSAQDTPIACTEHNVQKVDFYRDPTPPMPTWVLRIRANNLAAIQSAQ